MSTTGRCASCKACTPRATPSATTCWCTHPAAWWAATRWTSPPPSAPAPTVWSPPPAPRASTAPPARWPCSAATSPWPMAHAGQPFEQGRFTQHLEVPGLWLERGVIDAADERLLSSPLGLAGHRCMASMFFAVGTPLDRTRHQPQRPHGGGARVGTAGGARDEAAQGGAGGLAGGVVGVGRGSA